jgi:two-component system, OmpR family, sensor histidine kinase TctE
MTNSNWSLTSRLLALIAFVLTAGAIAIGLAAYAYGHQAAEEAYDRLLSGAAFQISQQLRVEGGNVVVDLPVAAFELLSLAPRDRVFYRIVAPNGQTITGYNDLSLPDGVNPDRSPQFYATEIAGTPVRAIAMTKKLVERDFTGDLKVLVAQTTEARASLTRDITQRALLMLLAASVVTVGLVAFAIRLSLLPLRRIEAELVRRDPKDLSPLNLTAPSEVSTLVASIDAFMARLSRRVKMMENLVADATHQLRTPIAAIRAQAEIAKDEQDVNTMREIATRIHRRSVGMSRLADQLLSQAMVAHRGEAISLKPVDLRVVAERAAEGLPLDLPESDRGIETKVPGRPVVALGDEFSLVEAVKNLVTNAFRHGQPPVTIEVTLLSDGNAAAIGVLDRGKGIPRERWKEVGNRFFTRDGRDIEGAGLGLAIAHTVAVAHHGQVTMEQLEPEGFRISITLPLCPDGILPKQRAELGTPA